jgi:hypothetical protein
MIIPSPSQLIKGGDIIATFQNLYNLLFAILLALAFLSFIYGAFQYLLSGANIFNQQEGKSRMKNSLIALIVVLIIPVLLNLINPKIFKGAEMTIPKFTARLTTKFIKININPNVPGGLPGSGTNAGLSTDDINNIKLRFCSFPENLSIFKQLGITAENPCSVRNIFRTIFWKDPLALKEGEEIKDVVWNDKPWSKEDALALAKRLSVICLNLSYGKAGAQSKTDVCKDGTPFSFGLFQINIFHTDLAVCDPKSIFTPGSTDQERDPNNSNRYNCSLQKNSSSKERYQLCKGMLTKPNLNIRTAFKLLVYNSPYLQPPIHSWDIAAFLRMGSSWKIIINNCGDPNDAAVIWEDRYFGKR